MRALLRREVSYVQGISDAPDRKDGCTRDSFADSLSAGVRLNGAGVRESYLPSQARSASFLYCHLRK